MAQVLTDMSSFCLQECAVLGTPHGAGTFEVLGLKTKKLIIYQRGQVVINDCANIVMHPTLWGTEKRMRRES